MRAILNSTPRAAGLLLALALAVLASGCDSDSPTGPVEQQVPPPTGQQQASAAWSITVSTSASTVDLNAGTAVVQVEVSARRADNNTLVPVGTTARLSTTNGTLASSSGTASEIPVSFDEGGVARATLTTDQLTAEGVIIVRAQIEQSFGSARILVQNVVQEAFQVTGVSPSVGPPEGGTRISITGSGFMAPVRVLMAAAGQTFILQDVRVASSGLITAVTPAINLPSGENALATITVENAVGSTSAASDLFPGGFTFTRSSQGATTLKIISSSPTFGPNEGGTQVSILGEGFGSQLQVFFGSNIEAQVLSVSPTRIEVVTPSATGPNAGSANSIVALRVRDVVTGQEDILPAAFQYGGTGTGSLFISAISPGRDEYRGGTLVTLFGQGFDEPVAVSYGGAAQQVISVSGTEILTRSVAVDIDQCSPQTGTPSVTNIETNENAAAGNILFEYVPIEPILVSVRPPASGPEGGGNTISIEGVPRSFGVGFDPPVQVTIDDVASNLVTLVGNNQINARVPPFTGTFPTEACGANNAGTRQIPIAVNVRVINVNTDCEDELTEAYFYEPDNTDCVIGMMNNVMANFTATDQDGSAATFVIEFADTSTGGPTSWLWSFPGGTPATSAMQTPPPVDFGVAGTRNVTLAVTGPNGTDTITQQVNVGTIPPL